MKRFRLPPAVIAPVAVIAAGVVLVILFSGNEPFDGTASASLIFMAFVFMPPVLNSIVGVIAQQRGLSRIWLVPLLLILPGTLLVSSGGRSSAEELVAMSIIPVVFTWFAGGVGWWISERLQSPENAGDT